MHLLVPFIGQNQKTTWDQIQGYEEIPILGQNNQIAPYKNFSEKLLI